MAMKVLVANRPRICLTLRNSMSSSSVSSPSAPKSNLPSSEPIKNPVMKRESLRSRLSAFFGGGMDHWDPTQPKIPIEDVRFPDVTEYATGEHKLMLLAFENGFLDPMCNLPACRDGLGTKDKPVPIESFIDERLVGCVCEEAQNHVKYTWVRKGEPKRCACGFWMELVEAPRFWEKIPKEDLLTIPFFRDLEEQGKLDRLLAGDPELRGEMITMHN